MQTECLHFARGKTASDDFFLSTSAGLVSQLPTSNGLVDQASAYRKDLASARPVETLDYNLTSSGTIGATGKILTPGSLRPIKLKAVQAGAAITVSKHGLLVQFDTDADRFGLCTASTYAGADGAIVKPIDGAYPIGKVISKYDWFWVVWDGLCYVSVANGDTVTQGAAFSCAGSGLAGAIAAGDPIVGVGHETLTGNGTASHDVARVLVNAGLGVSDPAS